VEKLRTVFGEVFVDGLTTDVLMLKDRYKGVNGYFFYFHTKIDTTDLLCIQRNRLSYYKADYDEDFRPYMPHLLLSFDKEKDLTEDDGMLAERFLQAMYDPRNHVPEEFFELVPRPDKIICPQTKELETYEVLMPDYSFEYKVDTSVDIAFCQVCKPNTDRPYTLVIRNFSNRGLKSFFSGIFASTSWGVSSHDYVFLQKLWKFLDMEKDYGVLDLEELLKDHVKRCTDGSEMEPEVYRLSSKTVQKNFEKSLAKKHRLLE
jgi:hypothetical protein